jgi:hypothetical protein
MATLGQVRSGLAARFATISGLNVYETISATPQVPCVMIRPASGEYDQAMASGGDMVRFDVLLLASSALTAWDVAQDKLDAYLARTGTGTLRASLQSDVTLGGTCHTARITGWREYGTLSFGGAEYMGCRVEVETWPT